MPYDQDAEKEWFRSYSVTNEDDLVKEWNEDLLIIERYMRHKDMKWEQYFDHNEIGW